MLISHGEQLTAKAEIFDKGGNLIREVSADNDNSPQPHEIKVIVKNQDGSIDREVSYPFRSFTYNWVYMLEDYLSDSSGNLKLRTDTTTLSSTIANAYVDCPYGSHYGGIVVGRSSSAPSISDPYLGSVCPHGTSTNQFDYSSTVVEEPVLSGSYYQIKIRRVLTNYSGASITVREIGLIGNSSTSFPSSSQYMLARDTYDYIGANINLTIDHNQSFEIQYIIRHAITSGFVENYLKALYAWMTGNEDYELTETDGSTTTSLLFDNQVIGYFDSNAAYGEYKGLLVGKGTTPPAYTDIAIDNSILHGSTTDRLLFGAMEYSAPVVGASDAYCQIARTFVNDGPGNVAVTEAIVGCVNAGNSSTIIIMHIPFTGITLQPTESMKVTFKVKVEN